MLDWLDAQIGEGDAVLFKGSNSMKLGEVAEHVCKRYP